MLITAGSSINQILRNNPNECNFELEPGIYLGPISFDFNLSNKRLYSQTNKASIVTQAGPYCINITPDAYRISFERLTLKNDNQYGSIAEVNGSDIKFDTCNLLGDPIYGQHRGIAANGRDISVVNSRIENCFLIGQDAQAICGWTGTKNLLIDGCYLEGGAQSVMIGGSDPSDLFRIPTNVKVVNSILTKKESWFAMNPIPQIKCALELKNCINFHAFNCTLQFAGVSQGQGSFLIVLTPRNQSGKAPFTTIQNVLIEHCIGKFAGSCVSFLGHDTNYPSGPLRNVTIKNCEFAEINHKIWKGSGRIFQFDQGPQNLTLEDISVTSDTTLNSNAYFMGAPPQNLIMRNIHWPKTNYDLKVDKGGMGIDAVRKYCQNLVFENSNPI